MTAIIGLACDCNFTSQKGNILLCADQLVSYSASGVPVSSNAHGSKMYDLPCGFFVAIADDISRSHQVVSFLHNKITELGISPESKETTDRVKLALARTADYVRLWIRKEICASYGVSEDEFLHDKTLAERESIRAELREAVLSTELIVGGFGYKSSLVLFYTNCVDIQEQVSPGIFCGGSGSLAALNWLNFRKQNCFMSTQRSYFHAREAMHFAELSRAVGPTCCTMLLRPEETPLTIGKDRDEKFITDWQNEFHVHQTDALDSPEKRAQFELSLGVRIKQSASQKLK
jgi:hypothetical protein